MRNLGRRGEFNERVELSETSKQGYHSNEKPENSEHLGHVMSRSTTTSRRDKYRPEEKLAKENLRCETEDIPTKENSTDSKEINNADIIEIKPDSKDATPEGWKKVLPRRKKSQKQRSPSKQSSKTETNGNESLLQNQYDRFKSFEQRRTYSNNCQQKKAFSKVSDRKATFFTEPKKKYRNKNLIHTSVQYSSQSSSHSSNESQSGHSELDEASVEICISTSNETTDKILNSGENVAETMPEKSNTKTLMKHSSPKQSTNCQLNNSPSVPSQTLTDEQNKVLDSTTDPKEHAYSNIEDKSEQNSDDSDDVLKQKQCNSQDEIEPKVDCEIIHETIKQSELNVYAKEFSPVDNQSIHGIKGPKEQRKGISDCPQIENPNEKITEHQQNEECPDLIKNIVRIAENEEQICRTCETDNLPNESESKIPENQFYQNLTFEPQFHVLPAIPEQNFNNEAQGPNEYENEFTYSSNSDHSEPDEPTFVFPEPLTGINQNDFNGYAFTTNLNMQRQSLVYQWPYNGMVYFYPYPYYNFGNYTRHNFLNDQRNCPVCLNANSFMNV